MIMNNKMKKIYYPDNSIHNGYFSIFKEIISEFRNNHFLIIQLMKRQLFAIYKQSLIGVFWVFIIPLLSILLFIVLRSSGIVSLKDIEVPYPIFALTGLLFWQFFSTGLIAGSRSIVDAGTMITKINFSKKSLVISSMAQSGVSLLIQLLLLIIICFYYGFMPYCYIFLIPIFFIPLFFLTLGLSFILSLFNSIIRDIGNIVSVSMTFFLFLTPIMYNKPQSNTFSWIVKFNPLFYLISIPRELILMGTVYSWKGYIISCVLSVVIFVFCIVAFHLTETRITERI